jgi:hypothetical protein
VTHAFSYDKIRGDFHRLKPLEQASRLLDRRRGVAVSMDENRWRIIGRDVRH